MINNLQNPVSKLIVPCLAWLGIWSATQGFYMVSYLQELIPGSTDLKISLITAYILGVLLVTLLTLRQETKRFLRPSRWLWLYLLPFACIAALLFSYQGPLHIGVFVAMITISVFWQDMLTFGLLQNYIQKAVPKWAIIFIVGSLFGLGHILAFIPDMTQLFSPTFYLLFAVGYLFAWLREKTRTVYVINVLHVTFLLAAMIRF